MKKILYFLTLTAFTFSTITACAQEDKSKRPSPPAKVTQKLNSGVTVIIDYSQPAVKGRTIGKDLEPMKGQVWRTGANEATVFEIDKDVTINGQKLPAGKYGLFSIDNGAEWTIIFNKTWKQWGAYSYKDKDDALRITCKEATPASSSERMTFTVAADGTVNLAWGNRGFSFKID